MGITLHWEIEGQPMPAYRDPEVRAVTIRKLVGILLEQHPELVDDLAALTSPPPVDERALAAGFGPYGDNFELRLWNHLASDIVPTEEEIREVIEQITPVSTSE